MKKIRKALITLLVVSLMLCIAGICTFAASEEVTVSQTQTEKAPLSSEYDFVFYDSSANKFHYHKTYDVIEVVKQDTVTTHNCAFKYYLEYMATGDVITLLNNIELHNEDLIPSHAEGSSRGTEENYQNIYIDLNGYRLSSTGSDPSNAMFQFGRDQQEYGNFYIYSSDTEHTSQIFAAAKVIDEETGTFSIGARRLFALTNNNYLNVYLGEATDVPLVTFDGNEATLASPSADCSGDIETFSGIFSYQNYQNTSITVKGGRHYQTVGNSTMIQLTNGATFNANGASFVANAENGILNAPICEIVNVDDCFLYTEGTVLTNAGADSEILFNDCRIAGSTIHTHNASGGTPEFRNCYFANSTYSDTINETVFDNVAETALLAKNTFAFSSSVDTTNASECYDMLDTSYAITRTPERIVYTSISNKDKEVVTVTWNAFGKAIEEKWIKSDTTIPTPPVAIASNDFYRFTFSPKIEATSITGDVTYDIEETLNFTIKANITLYADFVYNLYIPKSAGDSELLKWVRIDRVTSSGVARGTEFTLKDNDNIETRELEGLGEYYVVSQNIFAQSGDSEYRLAIGYDGYLGLSVYTLEFSIPDYVAKVNEGNYTSESKAMVSSALEYIKAASNYDANKNGATVKYTGTNAPKIDGQATKTKPASATDKFKETVYGAALNLNQSINFRFFFYDNFSGSATFTYKVNGRANTVAVSYDDIKNNDGGTDPDGKKLVCFDLALKAVDTRSAIDIALENGESYRYSLANYAYTISAEDTYLLDLIDSLWVYSVRAAEYYISTSTESPTVDFSVDGATITADTYEILIGTEEHRAAALAIKEAIYSKTGEELNIVTESTGKYAIALEVLDTPKKEYDFEVYVDGHNLSIASSFPSFIDGGVRNFLEEYIRARANSYDFSATFKEKYYTDRIYYSDFGAYGIDMSTLPSVSTWYGSTYESTVKPNLTNDFYAMREAHLFANETGRHTVYADEGATYYISESWDSDTNKALTIPIKTNVVWGDAHIIIDDSNLPGYKLQAESLIGYENEIRSEYWNKLTENTAEEKCEAWNRLELQAKKHVFTVESEYDVSTITDSAILSALTQDGPLDSSTTKIDLGLDYPAMLVIYNSSHKVYRRKGYSTWSGSAQHELVVIDKDGNVDSETKLYFSYGNVSKIEVYRLDDKPITVTGGSATTLASRVDNYLYDYVDGTTTYAELLDGVLNRGINVTRPNTTVSGLKHSIVGEITLKEYVEEQMIGPSYYGFFTADNTSDVTFENCTLQARRCYYKDTVAKLTGNTITNTGTSGTYDLNVNYVNRIKFDNCVQSNFFIEVDSSYNITPVDESDIGSSYTMSMDSVSMTYGEKNVSFQMHWGCGGTNFCKNMSYVDSTISRYDDHCGLYNGEIIGSSINTISIVGGGNMLIENTTVYSTNGDDNAIVTLRGDYGSTWDGDVIINNVTVRENQTKATVEANIADGKPYNNTFTSIIQHSYSNWYFGYESVFPNVTINNINYLYKDGTKITPTERGAVEFSITNVKSENKQVRYISFITEPSLGEDKTTYTMANYAYVDEDGDGCVDFTNEAYDSSIQNINKPKNGFQISDSEEYTYKNINKVKAPEYVKILGNDSGYDFTSILNNYKGNTSFNRYVDGQIVNQVDVTFFDNTEIIVNLEHNVITHEAKAPTCTEVGWEAYETCEHCGLNTYVEIPALGHDTDHFGAKAPTCTEIGWDAYEVCTRCDYTTYAEKAALGHAEIAHEAKAPTCTEIGWDAYVTCSRCDYTTYTEKAALGHAEIAHEAKAPTCTEIGWDAYVTCSRCDYTTYAEKEALGHTEVIDEAVAATCTETGLTEGKHCSVCNTVLVAQEVTDALGHDLVHHDIKYPTTTEDGWYAHDECTRCDYTTIVVIPMLPAGSIREEDTPLIPVS